MSKKKIVKYILMVLPLIMVLALYARLPEQVPMHWDVNGSVRYEEKIQIFMIPILTIVLGFFMSAAMKIDPRKENYKKFADSYEMTILATLAFMNVMMAVILSETMYPGRIDLFKVVSAMMALLFIALGNQMTKFRSNFFAGVKTPWALSSDAVWLKTQRLGGKSFFFGGIVLFIASVFLTGKPLFWFLLGLIIVIACVPTGMSYIWFQKELKGE